MISNKKIKVSITIPAYNTSRFIAGTIESVLAQDYDRFEVLVIDDGKTDRTWDIKKRYRNHHKVKCFRNNKNLGVGSTRNRLVRLARGEYITPCDADDIMLPDNLKRSSGYLDTHPDIGAVYADILVIERGPGKLRILNSPYIKGRDCSKGWDLIYDLVNHPGSMIRKSVILQVGGYDEAVYAVA